MTYTYKLSRRLASIHESAPTLRPLILLLLGLLATACGGGDLTDPTTPTAPAPAQPSPGWVSLVLSTPNADDGAVQVSVIGPAMDSLELRMGGGFASLSNGTGRFLVAGALGSGVIGRIWVPDTRKAGLYLATVEQAATRGTYQLRDVSQGYTARVTR